VVVAPPRRVVNDKQEELVLVSRRVVVLFLVVVVWSSLPHRSWFLKKIVCGGEKGREEMRCRQQLLVRRSTHQLVVACAKSGAKSGAKFWCEVQRTVYLHWSR
jgi:hypothetical protein